MFGPVNKAIDFPFKSQSFLTKLFPLCLKTYSMTGCLPPTILNSVFSVISGRTQEYKSAHSAKDNQTSMSAIKSAVFIKSDDIS